MPEDKDAVSPGITLQDVPLQEQLQRYIGYYGGKITPTDCHLFPALGGTLCVELPTDEM